MKIWVQTCSGKMIELNVEPNFTVYQLKEALQQEHGLPIESQPPLVHHGQLLANDSTLEVNRITDGTTLYMVSGGG
jgi:ubiquitin-like protein Nedd8